MDLTLAAFDFREVAGFSIQPDGFDPRTRYCAPFVLQVRPSTFHVEEAGSIPVRGPGSVQGLRCLVCDASGEATALSRQRGGFNSRTDRMLLFADLAVVVHASA